jgi:hypothetical protein
MHLPEMALINKLKLSKLECTTPGMEYRELEVWYVQKRGEKKESMS